MKLPFKGCIPKDYPQGNVTQWFGENPDLYYNNVKVQDGMHMLYHNGIDIVAPYGTPLLAVEDGKVSAVENSPTGYGRHVRISTNRVEGQFYTEWTYGHLSEISVKKGQKVKAGDVIGKMGNSGFVVSGATPFWKYNPYAGTHVHFGKRIYKDGFAQDYKNGAFGSVDCRWDLINAYIEEGGDMENDNLPLMQKQLTLISMLNRLVGLLKSSKIK